MTNLDPTLMMQTTLDLTDLDEEQRNQEAAQVMGGLVRLVSQLQGARDDVIREMRASQTPDIIFAAMSRANILAGQYHARDLLAVNGRAIENFSPLLGDASARLTPEATADVMVWLRVADQTLIAAKLLFEISLIHGKAPNGKPLPDEHKA